MGHKIQKTHHTQQTRILALDVHPRSFGYIVVESPDKLLDWGVRRSYQRTKSQPEVLARGRLRPLLKIWKPGAVVTRVGDRRNKGVQSLLRHMKKEAGATSFLPITGTRDYYLGRGKYQRAVEMAARFPEIGWKLPPKRKLGDSEHYLMSMFEALAIAVQSRRLPFGRIRARRSARGKRSESLSQADVELPTDFQLKRVQTKVLQTRDSRVTSRGPRIATVCMGAIQSKAQQRS